MTNFLCLMALNVYRMTTCQPRHWIKFRISKCVFFFFSFLDFYLFSIKTDFNLIYTLMCHNPKEKKKPFDHIVRLMLVTSNTNGLLIVRLWPIGNWVNGMLMLSMVFITSPQKACAHSLLSFFFFYLPLSLYVLCVFSSRLFHL